MHLAKRYSIMHPPQQVCLSGLWSSPREIVEVGVGVAAAVVGAGVAAAVVGAGVAAAVVGAGVAAAVVGDGVGAVPAALAVVGAGVAAASRHGMGQPRNSPTPECGQWDGNNDDRSEHDCG
jgi:hypothetical protein